MTAKALGNIDWKNTRVRLGDLKPWERNPKTISREHAKRLLELWDKIGQFQSIAIGPNFEVYDGHQRLNVLKAAHGVDYEVDARQSSRELTEKEREELVVAAHVGTVGQFDWDVLSSWDAPELIAWGMDDPLLHAWKRDVTALDALLKSEQADPVDAEPQIDRAAELNEKWQVVTGNLWQIGEHRLLCGDSTKREDVERVMAGEKADMVFTDPPYNVASESRNYAADKSKAMKDLSQSEWDKNFDITAVFPMLDEILAQDCAVYVCTSQWLVHTIWTWMWKWSDFCFYCVWCKPNPMPSLSKRHWTWATELIPYAVRGKHISNFPNDGHALNWWAIPKDKDTEHPTEKVLEVPTRAIQFSSNKGAIVFDGFCGSGTTMVACQNLNRKCRAIEISPNYCAVILERMSTAFPELEIRKSEGVAGG